MIGYTIAYNKMRGARLPDAVKDAFLHVLINQCSFSMDSDLIDHIADITATQLTDKYHKQEKYRVKTQLKKISKRFELSRPIEQVQYQDLYIELKRKILIAA